MDPPHGPRHGRGGRHSSPDEPSDDPGVGRQLPPPADHADFDPEVTIVLPGAAIARFRDEIGDPGAAGHPPAAAGPGGPERAEQPPSGWPAAGEPPRREPVDVPGRAEQPPSGWPAAGEPPRREPPDAWRHAGQPASGWLAGGEWRGP